MGPAVPTATKRYVYNGFDLEVRFVECLRVRFAEEPRPAPACPAPPIYHQLHLVQWFFDDFCRIAEINKDQ